MSNRSEMEHCVFCGAEKDLVADEEMEEVWYCTDCLKKRDEHQEVIDYGFEDEEPQHE